MEEKAGKTDNVSAIIFKLAKHTQQQGHSYFYR